MKHVQHTHPLPISPHIHAHLSKGRNLLAFSGGIDSSALFFVLMQHGITFDIVIVDYCVRPQSKDEVCYAKELATQYKKVCYTLIAEPITKDFECNARKIRYEFFHQLIIAHNYKNLITAHHFDDRLEWFLMQLSCGAGLNTLLGFSDITQRVIEQREYYLVRPFITYTKQEILDYNHANKIQYFIDTSNTDTSYKRNFFRQHIAMPMSKHFASGIKKSFAFLEKEQLRLYPNVVVCMDHNLFICKTHRHEIYTIDMLTKQLGYIMSSKQKDELQDILIKQDSCVMGGKIVIAKNQSLVFVGLDSPWFLQCFIQAYLYNVRDHYVRFPCDMKSLYCLIKYNHEKPFIKIPKQDREKYRIQNIPPRIRPLLYINGLDIW